MATQTFAQMGFTDTVTACSATPTTDGYVGSRNGLPYHIHPEATPEEWAAMEEDMPNLTVDPYVPPPPPPPPPAPTILQQIEALEATVTPRRMRDAVLTEAGKEWLVALETQIEALRAQLPAI